MCKGEMEAPDKVARGLPQLSKAPTGIEGPDDVLLEIEPAENQLMEEARPVRTEERYLSRLYVTGSTPRSARAIENTRRICNGILSDCRDLEVVDLYQHADAAASENIFAAPTLVKLRPAPLRRIIGDLSDRARALASLGLGGETASRV